MTCWADRARGTRSERGPTHEAVASRASAHQRLPPGGVLGRVLPLRAGRRIALWHGRRPLSLLVPGCGSPLRPHTDPEEPLVGVGPAHLADSTRRRGAPGNAAVVRAPRRRQRLGEGTPRGLVARSSSAPEPSRDLVRIRQVPRRCGVGRPGGVGAGRGACTLRPRRLAVERRIPVVPRRRRGAGDCHADPPVPGGRAGIVASTPV